MADDTPKPDPDDTLVWVRDELTGAGYPYPKDAPMDGKKPDLSRPVRDRNGAPLPAKTDPLKASAPKASPSRATHRKATAKKAAPKPNTTTPATPTATTPTAEEAK